MYGEAPKAIPEAFSHSEYPSAQARINQLRKWRQEALIVHQYAQERMKTRLKENYKPFYKGQKVWLEATNLRLNYNKKIMTKREGPFQILEVLPPVNYRLKLPEKWKMHDVFHASLLTPYHENLVHGPNFSRPLPDIIDNKEEFEVERILRHRGEKKISYQVKWTGYEDTTWEPEENLQRSSDLIADYWKRIKKPQK